MSGIDASRIYLPTPEQTKTTGAVAVAPIGTAFPLTASEVPAEPWESGGYVGDAGISVTTSKGTTVIKDWSQAAVRSALTDFTGTISVPFLQVDEFAATRLVGADNVTATAAADGHGNMLAIDLNATLPPVEQYVFSMKDGDSRIRIEVASAQVTNIDAISFVPNAANSWPGTLTCYVGEEGWMIRVIYEDGAVVEA